MIVQIEILNKRDRQVRAHAHMLCAMADLGQTATEIPRNEKTRYLSIKYGHATLGIYAN
jgi:hypothetical protein